MLSKLLAVALLVALAVPSDSLAAAAAEEKKEAPAWRVDAPSGPTTTVAFDTDEGTWLHLDVHPSGRELVFSLLGDLYLLPIGGGEARRISSGPAYDIQPRFSPDGRWIAFNTDRSGIENLWLCDLAGGQLRPVSAETETTVSAPAWSPDGEYLVGRKRITDRSILGEVELWLWHLKGGAGVQLTKREEQSDAADPAFSPDGRFVYYAGREARFQYDSNVNDGIWQLKRLDRRTGEVVQLTGEFGGAAAPMPSPDGKSLAFARRVRGTTRIEVLNLASGKTRVAAGAAQRDQQEGFAAHGVFPGFAWTPDSRAIVASAEGRFWRFDAAGGGRTPIPFSAHVEQIVTEALRFPRRVGEGDVQARVIRWPTISPDGSQAVFSALGSLYRMELPSGTPQRVTREDAREYAPSFSASGREIAYVTWDDREGGHVWRRPLGFGSASQVTQVPGHYANPAFSRDGSKLAFLKGSGASFRGQDLSDELRFELHWASAKGGESHYVRSLANRGATRRMSRPMFAPDGERIFFVDDEDGEKPGEPPKTVLHSVKLDGTDLRSHLRFERAEEVVISPDARHVAFVQDHDAWLSVLPEKPGDPIDVAAENSPLPLARLSNEGGEWVGFSDGGKSVSWAIGPTLRRVSIDAALRPREVAKPGEAQEDAEPELPRAESFSVRLAAPRARPTQTVSYVGARIVPMQGERVIESGVIVVAGDRLQAVGASDEVAIPTGARVVDVAGKTIIPGLFDEHAHLHYTALDVLPQQPWTYSANLAYGVTSTHDVSATSHEVFAQAELVEAGKLVGPRIFSTGEVFYAGAGPASVRIESLEDARRHVRRMKQYGAFTLKSYGQPGRNQRQWILQAAREEQVMVVPEGAGDLELNVTMILDGHTTVEHALPIAPLRKDVVTLFARSGTAYTPTLLVAYGGLEGDRWFHQHYDLWKDERLARFVPQEIIDRLGRIRGVMATDPADWHHLDVAASARDVLRAGGRVNLGGHGQMQGLGPHWEMWAFVQAGMTPLEALRVATLNPAQTLGLDRDLGSLEAGKLADFVVLDANPLQKIENSEQVSLVVKNGVAYRPEELALPGTGP